MERIETDIEAPAATECRDLVAAESINAPHAAMLIPRRSAAFVTQLLAVKAGLPQTRERRRADPDEAAHCYEQKMSALPPRAGRLLSRPT
jgi:hypothetical protein